MVDSCEFCKQTVKFLHAELVVVVLIVLSEKFLGSGVDQFLIEWLDRDRGSRNELLMGQRVENERVLISKLIQRV